MLQKLPASWIEENMQDALKDLFYHCQMYLQDFEKDSLVTLFVVAQCSGFPVGQYLKRYAWVPRSSRTEVLMLLNEIRQMPKKK